MSVKLREKDLMAYLIGQLSRIRDDPSIISESHIPKQKDLVTQ